MEEKIILKEVGVSVVKGAIALIPHAGTALNEVIFDCRGRVKQKRVNKFIEELTRYMEYVSENDINFDYIKSEDFGDIFESIMKRVVYNKSEDKMHRFKRILAKEMRTPCCSEFSETFLDIVSKINEKQIQILNEYRTNKNKDDINSQHRKHEFYDLDENEYTFYVQDLISKSLLIDYSIGGYGAQSMEYLKITQFGIKFLEFIEE